MKITSSQDQITHLCNALAAIGERKYGCKSSDPKYDAQRNLNGKTHYVEEDTLRYFKSRIQFSGTEANGLVFWLVESVALDMNNTKRGFRAVAWDIFGNVIFRPELEDCHKSSNAANKAFGAFEFDVVAHYRIVLQSMADQKSKEAQAIKDAISTF